MADSHLILTVIGDDKPGLVEELATAISSHGGNWLEASMAQPLQAAPTCRLVRRIAVQADVDHSSLNSTGNSTCRPPPGTPPMRAAASSAAVSSMACPDPLAMSAAITLPVASRVSNRTTRPCSPRAIASGG